MGMEMTEIVIALLMIVNNEIAEHRIQPSMGECLKGKRHAERQYQPNVQYSCIKSQAELETNIDGSITIKKLILN